MWQVWQQVRVSTWVMVEIEVKRKRSPLLVLRHVCSAHTVVPAERVNIHEGPEQPHGKGCGRQIEAQNAMAAMPKGRPASLECTQANPCELHPCGPSSVNQQQVLVDRPQQHRNQRCSKPHRLGEDQVWHQFVANQNENKRRRPQPVNNPSLPHRYVLRR